jgi:hypothetical protein
MTTALSVTLLQQILDRLSSDSPRAHALVTAYLTCYPEGETVTGARFVADILHSFAPDVFREGSQPAPVLSGELLEGVLALSPEAQRERLLPVYDACLAVARQGLATVGQAPIIASREKTAHSLRAALGSAA